ncbi:ABC transporter ATP-binding protein/permease [Phyllobacterium sp. 21LDTY02-6]|jgi:ATP-binding cassette, subfamily B, bacterial MsbA|uniref:ABC transporter ATP-binding protein n=1 Tax=unclassified Phyllobacterium TaxID=2638441 RepID=UPI0020228AEB|nr:MULTISPECIES: ABC transporter ATP-binding protein [unclassified Phyllobacterium]MCO4317226.1 ABC transporter ATP-binding protein/permease [Phyllobacterium sp. 21LDTY02-6]MCX8278791.1 ABC transporter ATP-binding protein [Phyllobacterium sp. 0TCS1.6C]MCX8293379.1 ABC transporter ATP-binding protein [Phyllobacterium sp. 0TCS1.6A]
MNGASKKKINSTEARRVVGRVLGENLREYRGSYAIAVIAMLAVAFSTAYVAYVFKDVINQIYYERRGDLIMPISLSIFGAFVLRGVATYVQSVTMARVGNNIVARYQRRIFDHLMKLGLDFYQDTRSAQLAARINQNIGGVRELLDIVVTTIGKDVPTLLSLVGTMILLDPLLSLFALLIGPPVIMTVRYLTKRLRVIHRESVTLNSHLLGAMQEATQGIAIVKAFTMEGQLRDKISTLISRAEGRANKISRVSERLTPVTELIAGIAIASMIAYTGYRAVNDAEPPGAMFSFITAVLLAYDPVRRLARVQVGVERALVNSRMIYEILDVEPRQADSVGAVPLTVPTGEVQFDNVNFSYGAEAKVLHGVTFTAQAGKTTAIVGASGAGKSTLIGLIQRFYDLDDGRILIDGQDIAHVSKRTLRQSIAYVSQQPYLFEGTIADNIRYGRPDATDEDVIEAAKLANADEFIRQQPDGYATEVGENGATLSGGQRQRLSIARAIIRNAPILLLDEATSALDNESEKRVQQALDRIMQGRTTIVIAHRLSTIVNADHIVVMEAGRVIEEGVHATLLKRPNGTYARFYQLQGREDSPIIDMAGEDGELTGRAQ